MTRRVLLALLLLLLAPVGTVAQGNAGALLDRVAETAANLQDLSCLLVGRLIDADGTEIALEVELRTIPAEGVASAYLLQPDALADNIIVLDGDTVASYTFLTHQVTLFDADDPDALGGLVGSGEDGSLDVTFDLKKLFAGFEATLDGEADTPYGPASVVRLDNVEEGAVIAWVAATIPESTLLPYRLEFHGADDALLAELYFEDLQTDVGLDAAEVSYLPDDAEILDERAER